MWVPLLGFLFVELLAKFPFASTRFSKTWEKIILLRNFIQIAVSIWASSFESSTVDTKVAIQKLKCRDQGTWY